MTSSPKPLLVYDGDCSFCRLWVDRWRAITGERVHYAPFQEAAGEFPEIPRDGFARAVQFITPAGRVYSAANAVFNALAAAPEWAWMLWLYQNFFGFAFISERVYGFVARHRNGLYRLTRVGWGKHFERPTFFLATWLFLRLMGVAYFFAFLSLATQIIGLIGHQGILPASQFLDAVRQHVASGRYWDFPSLAWISSSDAALRTLCVGGVFASILVMVDVLPAPALVLAWALYLSLVSVGQDFLSFQWDNLLLESGFLAAFIAPWSLLPARRPRTRPARRFRWLLGFLLFRLMFSSGIVKLLSGDPTWRNLTALDYHYYTQPLPTLLAWYAHLAPEWFQHASVAGMFFIELVAPLLIFAPRLWRFAGAGLLIFLQLLIALTGNYAYFNLLTVALCVLLFDDALLERIFPRRLGGRLRASLPARPWLRWRRWITAPVALVVLWAGLLQLSDFLPPDWQSPPSPGLLAWLEPARIVNGYGLFAVMTTSRPEIIIQGSNDGENWQDYGFKYKMGDPQRAPRWVAPFQPRLDWQMWFAALGGYRSSPWFSQLLLRLLEGSPPVLALLAHNPFPHAPPRYVRAVLYDYQFTTWQERRQTGNWWTRRLTGEYFPVVSLRSAADSGAPAL